MRHWVDNTGIHQFGRCHSGRGYERQSELEVSGFLQLATQIVFTEKINFSNLETPEVAAQSQGTISLLLDQGLSADVFALADMRVQDYKRACLDAVAKYVEDFKVAISYDAPPEQILLDAARPDIAARFADYVKESHRLLTEDLGLWQLDETLTHVLHAERSGGADKFMTAALRQLHAGEFRRHIRPGWSLGQTHDLCVRLRYYLNQELAAQTRGVYVPAVARARVVHRQSVTILAELERAFSRTFGDLQGDAAKDAQPVGLGLPSIANALVRLGKAEPRAIVAEAVAAREKAKRLRTALAHLAEDQANMDSTMWHEARLVIREHETALRQDLRIEAAPRFIEAFEVDIFGMATTVSPSKLIDWWAYRRRRKRISFLSEFAKTLADDRINDANTLRKLLRQACARATSYPG